MSLVGRKLFLSRGSDRSSGGGHVFCRAQVSLVAHSAMSFLVRQIVFFAEAEVSFAVRKLFVSRGGRVSCRLQVRFVARGGRVSCHAQVSRAAQRSLVLHELVSSCDDGFFVVR